jgi:hypothetical protein
MGYIDAISSFYHTIKPHPHPNLPLEGEGVEPEFLAHIGGEIIR